MGTQERKEREKERRRNEILDAAEKVFFSKGLHNATMDEVAEAAELSKGTVYLYFKNKEDLFYAINSRGADILRNLFKEAYDNNELGKDKLIAIGDAYFRYAREYREYFDAMLHYHSHKTDCKDCPCVGCDDKDEDIIILVAKAVEAGQQDGSITSGIPSLNLAFILWGQTTGIIDIITREKIHLDKMGVSVEEIIHDNYQLLTRGLIAFS